MLRGDIIRSGSPEGSTKQANNQAIFSGYLTWGCEPTLGVPSLPPPLLSWGCGPKTGGVLGLLVGWLSSSLC